MHCWSWLLLYRKANCRLVLGWIRRRVVIRTGHNLPPINSKDGLTISTALYPRLIRKPICSNTWHKSLGNRREVDSARVRFLRRTLYSKGNKEVIMSSAVLNQKPSEMRYRASRIAPLDSCHGRVIRNQQNLFPKFLLLP